MYREAASSRAKLDEMHRTCADNPTDENLIELRKQAIRHGIYSPETIADGAKSMWPIGYCEVCGYGPLVQGIDGREIIRNADIGHLHVCYPCEMAAGTITLEGYEAWKKGLRDDCHRQLISV